ncbi:MAG: ADP-ribosylglycohydrolase family protein [Firmicutes bacterium]|nr:ADP-ribosylglycohydrolase family protein [Bacillota bacterium]
MDYNTYHNKLKGALIGRFAGCALGAPVELMEIGQLIHFAQSVDGQEFPPLNYFLKAPNPDGKRYMVGKGRHFTRNEMSFLPPDDDIIYTLLSLLMLEKHGNRLTTEDVASFWVKYLPMECTFTSERTTLKNILDGVSPSIAATVNNLEQEYIGAAIRIDGYGYVHPGNPKKAVSLASVDAFLSHRDSGLHSAMYFSALISLAFTSKDIDKSMVEALEYIPKDSEFYRNITWALSVRHQVTNYSIANRFVTERFPEMSWVHSINNACLTIWGIHLGKEDFAKGISETVAMAYDNDCTAATVGSVLGAYLGIDSIDSKWYLPWHNRILSYLNGIDSFNLDDVIERFYKLGVENMSLPIEESNN